MICVEGRTALEMEKSILWFLAAIVSIIIAIASSQTIDNKSHYDEHNSSSTNQRHIDGITNESRASDARNNNAVDDDANKPHSRKKRLIWITDDGRLALPPGTALTITPTISLPLVRYPLEGFLSNMTMSFPLTIDFDKLGLTDNENPLGVLPPLFARSMGRAAGTYLGKYILMPFKTIQLFGVTNIFPSRTADYIGDYLTSRKSRSISEQSGDNFSTISSSQPAKLPDTHKHAFHGGERAILYGVAEDMLSTFGLDGKACLLRAICEIHSKKSLDHLGLIGEIAKLFFT